MNSFKNYKVFYGDLHNHCNISYAHGPLTAAFENARTQLDFVSVTGHADWTDMPEPDERIQYIIDFHNLGFKKLRKGWERYLEKVKDYNEEGKFVIFPGYEVHSSYEGDYTIVYKDLEGPLLLGESIPDVQEKLRQYKSGAVFAFPHHLAYPLGSRGVNWDVFSPDLTPALEILSMHGISESCESPRPFLHSMGPIDYAGTAQYGLKLGHQFGFLGNTDHHSAYPGSYGHGKTGVWAKSLSREDIWEAIFAGRTFALTGDKMDLQFAVNGAPMGSRIASTQEREIEIDIQASSALESVEVVKNNQVLRRFHPEKTNETENAKMIARIFLEVGWGEKKSSFSWRSRLHFPNSRILKIEPRFRGMEVVSPVEKEKGIEVPFRNGNFKQIDKGTLDFEVVSQGNPTNTTPATQGIYLEVETEKDSQIHAEFNEKEYQIPISRLIEGSYARNLGKIDSPAFRFHRLAADWESKLKTTFTDTQTTNHDFYYLRVKQRNNQWAYASPIWCQNS